MIKCLRLNYNQKRNTVILTDASDVEEREAWSENTDFICAGSASEKQQNSWASKNTAEVILTKNDTLNDVINTIKNASKLGQREIITEPAAKLIGKVLKVKMDSMEDYESRYLPAEDFGILILTTTKGVMSNVEARKNGIGGKLLAYVY